MIVPRVGWSQSPSRSASLCDLPAKGVGLYEVGERPLAADLDDGQPLPVRGLELGLAADIDLLQLEPELCLRAANDALSRRAEVAAVSVVEDDADYG